MLEIFSFCHLPMNYMEVGFALWDAWTKSVEDAGQYVGGFLSGLFTGSCPSEC
jgi:hypothetical protein